MKGIDAIRERSKRLQELETNLLSLEQALPPSVLEHGGFNSMSMIAPDWVQLEAYGAMEIGALLIEAGWLLRRPWEYNLFKHNISCWLDHQATGLRITLVNRCEQCEEMAQRVRDLQRERE